MSFATISAKVKALNGAVSGVTTAYDYADVPGSLAVGNLPAAVVLPRLGVMSGGGGHPTVMHEMTIVVYVLPVGQGTPAQVLTTTVGFINGFRDAYAAAQQLDSLSGVLWAHIRGYRVGQLEAWSGQVYNGVEFTLQVEEREDVTVGV